jgi:hypothetical protein
MGADSINKSQEENSSTHQRTISPRNSQPAAYSMPPPVQNESEISDSETESESELESHPDTSFDHIENQLGLLDDYYDRYIRSSLPPVDANISPVNANISPVNANISPVDVNISPVDHDDNISANKENDSEVNTDIVLTLGDNVRTTLSTSLWC